MSLSRLFDHTVRAYRDYGSGKDGYGETVPSWLAVADASTRHNARPDQNWSGDLQDRGPGEEQAAKRRWFLSGSLDVAERDVLVVTDGPEAPVQLRVLSVTKPTGRGGRVHHLEVNVEVYDGDVT